MPINSRNGKKISRPARNVNLVVSAMRNLRDENGSTVGNIVGYIADYCDRPAPKREVVAALKRGLEFGIIDRRRGRYYLQTDDKTTEDKKKTRSNLPTDDDGSELALEARKSAKTRKPRRPAKSKEGKRRRTRKSAMRKAKRSRISRALRSYKLDGFYQNPSYKTSIVSSLDSFNSLDGRSAYH